jgi:hypothetical protein
MEWARSLIENEAEISNFVSVLKDSPMKAFFFESKGVSGDTISKTSFEFVLIESTYLYNFADSSPDEDTFDEHFRRCNSNVYGCAFANLGGDSLLIVPKPVPSSPKTAYGHLAAFVRRAPAEQVLEVWKLTLQIYLDRIQKQKQNTIWLSTDGSGVAWLHIRLDPRPKYYDYKPFANPNR